MSVVRDPNTSGRESQTRLTPNSAATKTMSVISRENMIDFDKFAYGAAQSTLLFAIIAIFVSLYIWLGKVDLSGEGQK